MNAHTHGVHDARHSHPSGQLGTAIDPVCGMTVGPETPHRTTYQGRELLFCSADCKNKFEADPARYAPAAFGADVVVLTDESDVVEGTLDHAAWFKGRLYLFGTEQTHNLFVENPEKYASPPGIE